ncbi:Major facilitator superfamily domain, general substrate transporter [Cynara cardunculus var. scolymus]|uniref:Major facilitator superfamily domain, general substrate transporter n=1 Tax=Cynara cardunculus var. scolymus TaxID=59895 RepID=A0A118K351_CYNCS|nr:Major facilitator superfamily domain, general substrate transporter [Cynara cardunculus var. scolymus]
MIFYFYYMYVYIILLDLAFICYQGMVSLTISAILPKLRPPPCQNGQICQEADTGQLAILYISLLLTAIGSGGIRPCVVAFGADQFDETDEKQKTSTWKFFNWYYFCMGASMLVAVTVIVYIQDNVGWGWGLGVPSIAMAISIVAFVFGLPLYRNMDPSGSPFTRLVQVCVAAYKKRNLAMVSDPKLLYVNEELDASISIAGTLLHTKQMKFLDKAAIVTPQDFTESQSKPNLWRLNTVHRVEELKSLLRMGPIWASGIILFTAYVQQNTFSLQQAKTMNRHLTKSFQIPAGSMSVFTLTSMLATIVFYDRVFVPFMRRFTGVERGVSFLCRMAIGFSISVFATLIAGFMEIKRKNVAFAHGLTDKPHETIPIMVFWLVPQYVLHGVAEAFISIGHLEFMYDQAPESMRSTATALFWLAISAGNYMSTLLVTMIHKFSQGSDGSNWLPDNNLNKGKLEYFYWIITALQVLNLVYYLFCAKFYTFKPLEVLVDHRDKGDRKGHELELGTRV